MTTRTRRRSALAARALYLLFALPTTSVVSAYHAGSTAKPISTATASIGHGSNNPLPALYSKELFSVAPMMGHTNRHYRYYFRLFSRRAYLYTEMIPSSQILRAYRRARGIYLHEGTDGRNQYQAEEEINAEEMMEVMARIKANPGKEYQLHGGNDRDDNLTLHQLIGTSSSSTSSSMSEHPVVLQLGGKDPHALGMAAAIGAAYGKGEYHEINLNCGCPSNAVGGRSGGCSLMREPELVAQCVEQMNSAVQSLAEADDESSMNHRPGITVKHRLGVRDASTFDAAADREKNDEEAYDDCSNFIRTVSMNGDVTKFHVHSRLGLLGEFADDDNDEDDKKARQTLWVPGDDNSNHLPTDRSIGKIDHKREQERAKKRARKATVKNRHVPPLRPEVINSLADEFSQYEFVANGGIQTMPEVKKVVDSGLFGGKQTTRVVGAMVCSMSSTRITAIAYLSFYFKVLLLTDCILFHPILSII
jgi:tRNA-dihydrouridine synthase